MRLVVEYANATVVTPHGQGFYSVGLTYKGTLGSLLSCVRDLPTRHLLHSLAPAKSFLWTR
jgi:hypothetical protein